MPQTINAAVFRAQNAPMEIETITLDDPAPGEILVKVVGSGLCHSDLHIIDGSLPIPPPMVLGHEAAGVVEAVGEGVSSVAVGDHVITCLSQHCDACERCNEGRTWLCLRRDTLAARADGSPRILDSSGMPIMAFAGLGAFAEKLLVHESGAVVIDPDMPLDRAALIGCGVITGVGAAINEAQVRVGDTVAVIGCGGIGLSAVQGAALSGARTVIAVDLQPAKLELAQRMGATHVVNAGEVDPIMAVKEMTGGGVDHAFEAIGLKLTTEQAIAMLAVGGSAYLVGVLPAGVSVEVPGLELAMGGRSLHGVRMGSSNIDKDFPRMVELYQQGKLLLDEMIAERIPLDQVNEGYDRMKTGEAARSVIMFD